jgi:hypothetical protein
MKNEIEVTQEMMEAGEEAVLQEVGGAGLGGYFSATDLAVKVYRAMQAARGDNNALPRATLWMSDPVCPVYRYQVDQTWASRNITLTTA